MAEPEFVSCSVFVAVRARPFNSREKELNSRSCLKFYEGTSVQIGQLPPQAGGGAAPAGRRTAAAPTEPKSFTFDKAYPSNSTQEEVFADLGEPVVAATLEGYNACIFAYGQTGSGKSFSMLGPSDAAHILAPAPVEPPSGEDEDVGQRSKPGTPPPPPAAGDFASMRGLIPRILEKLFDECQSRTTQNAKDVEATKDLPYSERTPKLTVTVEVSYLEIYQEKVRCLLAPEKGADLKVRSTPEHGTFVENLTKVKVASARDALLLLSKGNSERVVGSTNMNDKSSRSHAIFSFVLRQSRSTETEDGPNVTDVHSQVNLVDLAGSERAKSTGAEGDRLREGANINKSLTVLGLVISGLAEQSSKAASSSKNAKPSTAFIPYRDSKLTLLLKENLGGNSKTFMLSALSPAEINYEETLSTLRYADRAKAIVTKACINEDAKDKMIRQLQAELERLRKSAAVSNSPAAASPAGVTRSPATASPAAQSASLPYLVNVETTRNEWAVFQLAEGLTYSVGKRNPGTVPPDQFIYVALEDEDDIAEVHLTLSVRGVGSLELRATSAPDFYTDVNEVEVLTPRPIVVENKHMITMGEATCIRFVDPRVAPDKGRRDRAASRIGGAQTARNFNSSVEATTPIPSSRAVPPLKLELGSARRSSQQSPIRDGDRSPAAATPSPPPSMSKPFVPALRVPPLGHALPAANESVRSAGTDLTTSSRGQVTPSNKESPGAMGGTLTPPAQLQQPQPQQPQTHQPRVQMKSEARDELVAMYHHTLVLLGERESGKTAFRRVLGKDLGFFERKVAPATERTMGFEIERLEKVGGTAKCSLTFLEIAGHRAFTPLCWMIPQTRTSFILVFKLTGSIDGARCDLHYFQPYIDLIRAASPSHETGVLLLATHRDMYNGSDAAVAEVLAQAQMEINSYWQAVEPVAEKRPQIHGAFAISAKDRTVFTRSPMPGLGGSLTRDTTAANSGSVTARVRTGTIFGNSDDGVPGASPPCRKMSELLSWLVAYGVTACRRDSAFIKGLIPVRIMQVLSEIETKRLQGKWALTGVEYRDLAKAAHERYAEKDELLLHTQLLHAWMRLYHHYRHTHLKRLVIIDVAWLFRIITAFCCAGECVRLGAFSPRRDADSEGEWMKFARSYQNAQFPFNVSDVRQADALALLPRGILTESVAAEIFKSVLQEKRFTTKDIKPLLDLLEQFDLTLPATKVYAVPPKAADGEDYDDDDELSCWATEQDLISRQLIAKSTTRMAHPDLVYTIPSYFTKPAPETVTVFVPELLSVAGPTVCFSLHAVPIHFLSRLATRLARFSNGVFFGAVPTPGATSVCWGDCVWIVCGETTRVLLRLVSRSLFVTFHDHEDVAPANLIQAKVQRTDNGLATARGGDAQDGESVLDNECYEAFLASTVEKDLSQPLPEREALFTQVRRGMILRRETTRQALVRQIIRDLIMESPGASYRERDRVGGDNVKWREVETRFATTMHSSQIQFNKLRELLEKQQQQANDNGSDPYFSPAPGEEADDGTADSAQTDEVQERANQLHQQLLREAERTSDSDPTVVSHAFKLDVDACLKRLTASRLMGDAAYTAVKAALTKIAHSRERLQRVEVSRYRFFAAREESAEEVSEKDAEQQLNMLRMLRHEAASSEVAALDALVAALSGPLT